MNTCRACGDPVGGRPSCVICAAEAQGADLIVVLSRASDSGARRLLAIDGANDLDAEARARMTAAGYEVCRVDAATARRLRDRETE
jgi:hypothetical protein